MLRDGKIVIMGIRKKMISLRSQNFKNLQVQHCGQMFVFATFHQLAQAQMVKTIRSTCLLLSSINQSCQGQIMYPPHPGRGPHSVSSKMHAKTTHGTFFAGHTSAYNKEQLFFQNKTKNKKYLCSRAIMTQSIHLVNHPRTTFLMPRVAYDFLLFANITTLFHYLQCHQFNTKLTFVM